MGPRAVAAPPEIASASLADARGFAVVWGDGCVAPYPQGELKVSAQTRRRLRRGLLPSARSWEEQRGVFHSTPTGKWEAFPSSLGTHPLIPWLGLLSLLSRPEGHVPGEEPLPPHPSTSAGSPWMPAAWLAHLQPRVSLAATRPPCCNGKEMNEPPLGNLPWLLCPPLPVTNLTPPSVGWSLLYPVNQVMQGFPLGSQKRAEPQNTAGKHQPEFPLRHDAASRQFSDESKKWVYGGPLVLPAPEVW